MDIYIVKKGKGREGGSGVSDAMRVMDGGEDGEVKTMEEWIKGYLRGSLDEERLRFERFCLRGDKEEVLLWRRERTEMKDHAADGNGASKVI